MLFIKCTEIDILALFFTFSVKYKNRSRYVLWIPWQIAPKCYIKNTISKFVFDNNIFKSLTVLLADPAEPSGQEENLCKICMDSPIDCVLLECGHMVTCSKCGKRMNECPICRQYVVRAVHVFRSWNSGAKRKTAYYRLLLFHTLSNILSMFSHVFWKCCILLLCLWVYMIKCTYLFFHCNSAMLWLQSCVYICWLLHFLIISLFSLYSSYNICITLSV